MAEQDYPVASPILGSYSEGLTESYRNDVALSTGDLRRRYDFGERFSELSLAQTPFFRLVSTLAKKPTDDPQFKFTEKRQSFMKRYAYCVGFRKASGPVVNDASFKKLAGDAAISQVGDECQLLFASDYKSAGNLQNVYSQTTGAIKIGDVATRPEFFQKGQVIKVPTTSTANGGAPTDYMLFRVTAVKPDGDAETLNLGGGSITNAEIIELKGKILRFPTGSLENAAMRSNANVCVVAGLDIAEDLEGRRSYVVGNAHEEGSSLTNEEWKDNPYSTGYGQTQIFRTQFGMTNTARATALKYEPNEWARVWKDKLIEHKWDIEHAGLFSTQVSQDSINHTQGAVDYVLNYGNLFSWTSTKTIDDFLQDMSRYQDPRYNQDAATVFLCSTEVYTWLHKLGGFFKQNLGIGSQVTQNAAGNENVASHALFGADLAVTGRKKVMGLDVTEISTVYGNMNVARCIALDGSHVKILALNMNNVKYRPLVGNGVNRDTSIYVGVQNLENSGVDKRVDMILTEAGFEYMMPESHAIWV